MPFDSTIVRLLPSATGQRTLRQVTLQPQGDNAAGGGMAARLERLFQRDDLVVEPENDTDADSFSAVGPSKELLRVTHRIAGQFIDVIKLAARQLLSGQDVESAAIQMDSALDALDRLALVASDERHTELLTQMRDAVRRFLVDRAEGRGHTRFCDALRAWLPEYADHVGGSTGAELRDLVECDVDEIDIYRHLSGLRGVGPRRLVRLYAAGLYTAEAIRGANADEMAQVTGLPRKLAHEVVAEACSHAERQAREAVVSMPGRLDRFLEEVGRLDPVTQRAEIAAACAAAAKMREALIALGGLHAMV